MPADFAANSGYFSDDNQLQGRNWLAAAVDEEAFLNLQHCAATAEIPRRRPGRTEDGSHAIGSDGCLDAGREMEADRKRSGFADLLAALRDQPVLAANFLPVIAKAQATLMDQAETLHLAVVARLDTRAVIVFAPGNLDIGHAPAKASISDYGRGICVIEHQR